MADPTYPAFSIFAVLSFILVLIPLPWHLQAWNAGTCLYMIWTALGCLNLFINSIIWHNNAIDWAPLWCDISTRIIVAVAVAIPAASLCINRRLYIIASCQSASISMAERKRAVLVDLAIGVGIPLVQIPLQFVVQGHRYDIFGDVGCYPTTVNTPAAYPLSFVWPNIIGMISAVYCILTLRAFMKRRAEFTQFLSRNTSLTVTRYFRLMLLATVELLFNLPLASYGLYLNATGRPIYKWKSWSDTHSGFFIIDTYPSIQWRASKVAVINMELSRWSLIFCALLFFAFFGFADEAKKNYKKMYWSVAKWFGIVPPPSNMSAASKALAAIKTPHLDSSASKDIYIPRPLQLKPTKHDSFSTKASTYNITDSTLSDRESIYHDTKSDHDLEANRVIDIALPRHSTMASTPSSYSSDTFTFAPSSPSFTITHKDQLP